MKKAIFFYYLDPTYNQISGSMINMFDYCDYLYNYKNYDIISFNPYDNILKYFKLSKRNYNFQISKISKYYDIFITDFLSLIILTNLKRKSIFIGNLLYIMDNYELWLYLNNIPTYGIKNHNSLFIKIFNNFKFKKIIFLVTPVLYEKTKEKFGKIKNIEIISYLKKINIEKLKTIKFKNNGKWFKREIDCNLKGDYIPYFNNIDINIFDYSGYLYKRRKAINYFELFGRLIFEFKILNKKVKFCENLMNKHDGLIDYINYYSLNKEKIIKKIDIKNENLFS